MSEACSMHEELRYLHDMLLGTPKKVDHFGDQGINGKVILKGILEKCGAKVGGGFNWLRIGYH